jgi:CheY-like chemotaxis protein
VFVPYKQLRAGAKQAAGGTGLGLPIAKSLIEAHSGTINCTSTVGRGSIFSFQLRVQRCSEPKEGDARSTTESSVMSRSADAPLGVEMAAVTAPDVEYTKCVAIVDDQAAILSMMAMMLTRAGVSHVTCLDGDEIVDRCKRGERFQVILMDRQMVRMNGEEATRAIRRLGISSNVTRIVGLTGDAMQEDMKAFYESGLDEVRTKPLLAHEWKEIERRLVYAPAKSIDDTTDDNIDSAPTSKPKAMSVATKVVDTLNSSGGLDRASLSTQVTPRVTDPQKAAERMSFSGATATSMQVWCTKVVDVKMNLLTSLNTSQWGNASMKKSVVTSLQELLALSQEADHGKLTTDTESWLARVQSDLDLDGKFHNSMYAVTADTFNLIISANESEIPHIRIADLDSVEELSAVQDFLTVLFAKKAKMRQGLKDGDIPTLIAEAQELQNLAHRVEAIRVQSIACDIEAETRIRDKHSFDRRKLEVLVEALRSETLALCKNVCDILPACDRQVLAESTMGALGDEQFSQQIMTMFCTECVQSRPSLLEAIKTANIKTILWTCHRLKGTSAMLGAKRMNFALKVWEAVTKPTLKNETPFINDDAIILCNIVFRALIEMLEVCTDLVDRPQRLEIAKKALAGA